MRTWRRGGAGRCIRLTAGALLVVLAGACQPFADDQDFLEPEAGLGEEDRPAVDPLDDGLEQGRQAALEWQHEAALAEVLMQPDEAGEWSRLQLTYVGADSDRLLVVTITPEGVSQRVLTLETLELEELPAAAVSEIRAFPTTLLGPVELVEATGCGRVARSVLYTTGAPTTWNGRAWTQPPVWSAAILTERAVVSVNPRTGAGDRC